jgi:hypothetical protein
MIPRLPQGDSAYFPQPDHTVCVDFPAGRNSCPWGPQAGRELFLVPQWLATCQKIYAHPPGSTAGKMLDGKTSMGYIHHRRLAVAP